MIAQSLTTFCSIALTSAAHIFCTVDQVEQEIQAAFDFLDTVYKPFGFNYKVGLSTRNPKKWMGDLKVWDKAESALQAVLEKRMPGQWKENPEDAAFYGPKASQTQYRVTFRTELIHRSWTLSLRTP